LWVSRTVAAARRASAMISRPSRVVNIISTEANPFVARETLLLNCIRRCPTLRLLSVEAALDFLAMEAVFDLAADRALAGNGIVLAAPLDESVNLGCAVGGC
jgi:hypothetical protein